MALLRMSDLRAMRSEDLESRLRELSDELMHERGVAAMGGAPASPGKMRALRSNIARIHTVMLEKERAAKAAPSKAKAPKRAAKKARKARKDDEEKERDEDVKEEKK